MTGPALIATAEDCGSVCGETIPPLRRCACSRFAARWGWVSRTRSKKTTKLPREWLGLVTEADVKFVRALRRVVALARRGGLDHWRCWRRGAQRFWG